ncbi:MAG: phenylacetate-CoA oxygenase subunit PaaJ [Ignavibacteria bacterium]|nr:phenylacetate-CoA oxygenase subunit PaaJ [Ignavibacteria bacterium]
MSEEEARIWNELGKITDPEIPALTLTEMKVIRSVRVNGKVTVVFSPTYVGCPATAQIMQEIRTCVAALGYREIAIETSFTPPWSTDMLDEDAREKLRMFGIAPPPDDASDIASALELAVHCPSCKSDQTTLESSFGSALCRQIFYCRSCRQSFERIKPI